MEPRLGETIELPFPPLVNPNANGAPADADSLPTCAVYEQGASGAILTPTVLKRAATTGLYHVLIDMTTGNGFDAGKCYSIYGTATVAGMTGDTLLARFQLRPTFDAQMRTVMIESDRSIVDGVCLVNAAVAEGKVAGAGTAQVTIRNRAASVVRLIATITGRGNREVTTSTPYSP